MTIDSTITESPAPQKAWRVKDWLAELGNPFSRVMFYNEVNAGRIKVRKAGKNILVTTSPADYLAALPTTLGRSPNPRHRAA
jgi:hypothetical protein